MDALAVVKQLHSLAENPENRASIVKDQGCLPGLVLFLDNKETEVVLLVLKTLLLLAEHVPNRKIMHNEMGMLESLKKVRDDERYAETVEVRNQASKLINRLTKPARQTTSQARVHTVAPTSQKFFVGSSNKKAKLIILQVTGLHDESTKKLCEDCLLSVRGVVSFTFNMAKRRCMVRVTQLVRAETLCKAIESSKTLSAEQITKNKSGEEVVISFGKNPTVPDEEKAENDFPDYLPEDDPVETSKTALARPGDKDKAGGSGWLSGVSSFISNSLYW